MMNPQIKRSYKQKLNELFYKVRTHPYYQKIMMLPLALRIVFASFLFCFGIVGLVTPIPAGWLMILAAGILVFGLRSVRRQSLKFFFLLRIHRIIEWIRYKMKK